MNSLELPPPPPPMPCPSELPVEPSPSVPSEVEVEDPVERDPLEADREEEDEMRDVADFKADPALREAELIPAPAAEPPPETALAEEDTVPESPPADPEPPDPPPASEPPRPPPPEDDRELDEPEKPPPDDPLIEACTELPPSRPRPLRPPRNCGVTSETNRSAAVTPVNRRVFTTGPADADAVRTGTAAALSAASFAARQRE
ncbi:MAG: hypothetical protein SFV18_05655 [Bryobacteraceae bacterium]|nr:hypothetical protein [Bryobacteraceae bacterium]